MNLKRFVEISPALGAFLIFLGYFKLSYYYSHWGIPIYEYLDFSEILLSFLNDLNVIIFFTVITALQVILGMSALIAIDGSLKTRTPAASTLSDENAKPEVSSEKDSSDKKEDEQFEGLIPEIDDWLENKRGQALLVIFLITAIFATLFIIFKELVWLYFSFMTFIQLLMYFIDKILGIKDEKIVLQLSTAVISILFTWCLAMYDIHQTDVGPSGIGLKTSAGEMITTNGNLTYLGRTNRFYIFYDESKKQSFSLSASEVVNVYQVPADSAEHVSCVER